MQFPWFHTGLRLPGLMWFGLVGAPLLLPLALPTAAYADVVGRLKFTVKDAATEKPVAGAKIVLRDTAGVRPPVELTTNASGEVTTPPLENRAWAITVTASDHQDDKREVIVAADVTTDVEVLLEPLKEQVFRISAAKELIRRGDTSSAARRDRNFDQKYPSTAGNVQSLSQVLRTVPGFVENSVNQVHPRGEHSSTAIYINGFLLPGVLQGRAGQFLAPDAIQTMDVQTGGYAPEYGGETAAILNLTLRSGTMKPFTEVNLDGGGFGTFQGVVTVGGQGGAPIGAATADGGTAKRLGYLINVTQRNTDNAIEPPQPDRQNAHNAQSSTTLFTNLTYRGSDQDEWGLILNTAPARTDIANRTGLPERFASLGQGYGYAGLRSAAEAATDPNLRNQQELGQDIYQEDTNTFGVLQYRRTFSPTTSAFFSLGISNSRLAIRNNNPGIDLQNLPEDRSIEFNPTITRDYDQIQLQANFTATRKAHTLKFGALYADQRGDEAYQFIPASQAALAALLETDPRLAPEVLEDSEATENGNGTSALSEAGRQQVAPGATAPTLSVKRDGFYAAAYAQDTFRATSKLTLNYGLRLDSYQQEQNLGQPTVSQTELSPRINAAYAFTPRTVTRAIYNRLFTQPPLAQGAILGSAIKPQIADHYETNIEQQIGSNQTLKLAYYQKEFRNQLDTGILIEGTQIGAYNSISLEKATVKGVELSYDLLPRNNVGLSAYLAWANSVAQPRGVFVGTDEVIDDAYNDHDQLNTISTGLSYTLPNGAFAGLNLYYGSGNPTSALEEGGSRTDRTEVNLRLSSGQRLFRAGYGLELSVENLFDQRRLINYASPFSGTRFQQGRRILLSATGRF